MREADKSTVSALAVVDLAARRGTVLGLLGPNGPGKTTTVRVLATLLRPDAGQARVLGHDVGTEAPAVRADRLTGQYTAVDEALTGRDNVVRLLDRVQHLPGHAERDEPATGQQLAYPRDVAAAADETVQCAAVGRGRFGRRNRPGTRSLAAAPRGPR